MLKKSFLFLLAAALTSSCDIFPLPKNVELSFDIHDLQSERVEKVNFKGYASNIKIAITGDITDSTAIQWGSLDSADAPYPYYQKVLPAGKVNYYYKGDFYGKNFYLKHTPFGSSPASGKLKADVIIYTSGR